MRSAKVEVYRGLCPWISLRLGHDTALTATGSHSLPCRRFATPPKNFLKKVLWNLKNFQKWLFINIFLKVLEGSPEGNFFQEVSLWRSPRSPHKLQFAKLPDRLRCGEATFTYINTEGTANMTETEKISVARNAEQSLYLYHKIVRLSTCILQIPKKTEFSKKMLTNQ